MSERDGDGSARGGSTTTGRLGWADRAETAFPIVFFTAVAGIAGALVGGVVVVLATLDLERALNGLGVMLSGIFVDGSILAALVALLTALGKLPFDRRRALPTALAVGGMFFFVYALVPILDAAVAMSGWGSLVGFALGAPFGLKLGVKQAAAARRTRLDERREGRQPFGLARLFNMSWEDWNAR